MATITLTEKIPIKSLLPAELEEKLEALGQPKYRAGQLLQWLYQKRVKTFAEMTNLSASLRQKLDAHFRFDRFDNIRKLGSDDSTRKYLFRLADDSLIESVLIPASPALYGEASDRRTLCVSSQVGCAYGCKFCASGLDGFSRNLHAGEMVDQILCCEELSGERINNVVFMGMGEPLANYDNLMRAIAIINGPWGIGLGARHITISTSGLAPQIRALADHPLQIRLAISLHGATDEVRSRIMPVNRKYNLDTLWDACAFFAQRKKQRITFEYILIDQLNDTKEQAVLLATHAKRFGAKVNLIPCNEVEGLPWARPSVHRQEAFLHILESHRVSATIRREKGGDIEAACGQLRLQVKRAQEPLSTPASHGP